MHVPLALAFACRVLSTNKGRKSVAISYSRSHCFWKYMMRFERRCGWHDNEACSAHVNTLIRRCFGQDPENTKLSSPLDRMAPTRHLARHGHEIVTSSIPKRERGRLGIVVNVGVALLLPQGRFAASPVSCSWFTPGSCQTTMVNNLLVGRVFRLPISLSVKRVLGLMDGIKVD